MRDVVFINPLRIVARRNDVTAVATEERHDGIAPMPLVCPLPSGRGGDPCWKAG